MSAWDEFKAQNAERAKRALQPQGCPVANADHVQQEDAHSDDANGGDEHARGRRHGDVGGNEIPHETEDGDDDNELDQVHKPALQRRHNDSMMNCPSGKRGHPTEAYAHKVRRGTVLTNAKNGKIYEGALNVYRCKQCDQWHVGHTRIEKRDNS